MRHRLGENTGFRIKSTQSRRKAVPLKALSKLHNPTHKNLNPVNPDSDVLHEHPITIYRQHNKGVFHDNYSD